MIEKKSLVQKMLRLSLLLCLTFSITWYCCGQVKVQAGERVGKAITETPKQGGSLKIGINGDAASIGYPPLMSRYYDYILSRPCVEALGRNDRTGKLVPWLATSWRIDPKSKTVAIALRKDVKFHDGTDFNAAAVKWNLDQFRDAGREELKNVASIDIIDNYTIRINLASFDNTIMMGLIYAAGPMISPTAFNKNGKDWCSTHPVGTGPFQFVSWERDTAIKYRRFNGYWQNGKPYLDSLEWRIIKDTVTANAALKAQEIDVNVTVSPTDVQGLRGSYNVVRLDTQLGVSLTGLTGDSAHPDSPFANVKVRQAIGYAVDRNAIVDTIFRGFGTPTAQWGAPPNWAYNQKMKVFYNPEKARKLLAEAGYPNGFKTKLLGQNLPDIVNMMTAVQEYLARVGIEAQIDPADGGRFRMAVTGPGWDGLIVSSIKCDGDNLYHMRTMVHSSGSLYGKNLTHPQKIDKLIDEAAAASNMRTKTTLMHQLQQVIFEEYSIFAPVFLTEQIAAKHPSIHNDGFYLTEGTEWTPENVWMKKK
jgi:peptide/nickel transport system substrate-binding protein